jgi:hypothetical protein
MTNNNMEMGSHFQFKFTRTYFTSYGCFNKERLTLAGTNAQVTATFSISYSLHRFHA